MSLQALEPVSLRRFAGGNAGVPYVWTFTGPEPGPHVLVTAIVHGNEACGAHALANLIDNGLRPTHGRLTFAFANIDAYETESGTGSAGLRYLDEDMNRLWTRGVLDDPARRSRELERARALRPVVDTADFLLDLHSMQQDAPPTILCGLARKTLEFARRLELGLSLLIDRGHAAGVRLRDYAGFAEEWNPKLALLVECGAHNSRCSARVAEWVTLTFLEKLGVIGHDTRPGGLPRPAFLEQDRRVIEITDAIVPQTDAFRFLRRMEPEEIVAQSGTVIALDGEQPIATPYDNCLLVMPSASARPGQTAVRFGRVRAG